MRDPVQGGSCAWGVRGSEQVHLGPQQPPYFLFFKAGVSVALMCLGWMVQAHRTFCDLGDLIHKNSTTEGPFSGVA